jgi:hypothetical protein
MTKKEMLVTVNEMRERMVQRKVSFGSHLKFNLTVSAKS